MHKKDLRHLHCVHHGPATSHLTEEKHATRTWDTGHGLRGMSNDSEWCDNDPFIEFDVRWHTNWLIENMPFNQLSLNLFVGIIIMTRLTLHCYVCCVLGAHFYFHFYYHSLLLFLLQYSLPFITLMTNLYFSISPIECFQLSSCE